MIMEYINTHTHTGLTGHGNGTIAEVVQAADEAGISILALTEHFPLSHEVDPDNFVSMPWDALDPYVHEIEAQRALHPTMQILVGTEFDWLGDYEDRDLSSIDWSRFDIILGSVHYLDMWPFDDPEQVDHWDEVGHDAIWERYFDQFCTACVSDMPYTVMAHPDLVKKFAKYPSVAFDRARAYAQAADRGEHFGSLLCLQRALPSYRFVNRIQKSRRARYTGNRCARAVQCRSRHRRWIETSL